MFTALQAEQHCLCVWFLYHQRDTDHLSENALLDENRSLIGFACKSLFVQPCAFIPQLHALLPCSPSIQTWAGLASLPNHSLIYWVMTSLPCNFSNLGRYLIFALTTLCVSIHTFVFSISLLANWRKDLFVIHSLTNNKVFLGNTEYLMNIC